MSIALLALKSFRNRKFTTGLAITSITLSVALLLAVEILRNEAKTSFTNTISGTDLIVGARSSPVHLLLYSVFGIGSPTKNLEWSSYIEISHYPQIEWSIPISMGDTHKGFRVLGTDISYFEHYRYGRNRRLSMLEGAWNEHAEDAVLGAEAAASLGYRLGDKVIIAHGAGDKSFITHDDNPFQVAGVLERTGTPIDRTVIISLAGFDDMHQAWITAESDHVTDPLLGKHADTGPESDRSISAFLLGLKSRAAAIGLQRSINQFESEPLSAILPGVALLELWEVVGLVDKTLFAVSIFVVIVGLCSMLIILMTSMNERRREMAILRSLGATPKHIFSLIVGEAIFITQSGIILGIVLVYGLVLFGQGLLTREFGLFITLNWFTINELYIVLMVSMCGFLIGLIPAIRAYRYSLNDGMTVNV